VSGAVVGTLKAGETLYRVADPTFGLNFKHIAPAPQRGGRFDCTDGSYGYTYLAAEPHVAMAEVFTRDLAPSTEIRTIPATHLAGAVMQTVETVVDIEVQLLHGKHLTRIGQTADLTKSEPHTYPHTRAIASQLIAAHPTAQGLRYRPRHDEDGFAYLFYTKDPDQPLTRLISRVDEDQPLGHGEGLEQASMWLSQYNVSIER